MYISPFPLGESLQSLRNGELDLMAYLNQVCDRIDAVEPQIQAFVPEPARRERLLHEAESLLARYPEPAQRPPLFGILVGVKDIFRVDGFPTRAGSQLPPELFDGEEAIAVTQLKEAGVLIVGKTVTTEFAYFQPGPTRNPHNTDHTPGGSSSGSAAGVAAGFCQLALGTQTIGSVIRPAAFCGIIGFKPSYDRIATSGLLYFSRSLDHVGLFTQDLEGMKAAASVLCVDWNDELAGGQAVSEETTKQPVIAVPTDRYLDRAQDEGRAAFHKQLERLETAGFEIVRIDFFSDFDRLERQHRRLMAAEAFKVHEAWYAEHSSGYSKHMHEIMEIGKQVDESEAEQARRDQVELRQAILDTLTEHNAGIWLAPAATGPAPQGIESTGDPIMNLPWTNAGVPVVTVSAGAVTNGLPLGLQIVAPFGQDEELLGWAAQIQKALDH